MTGKLKVVALADFLDKEAGSVRKKGERFEATASRLEQLNACGPEQGGVPLAKAAEAPKRARKARDGEEA